MIFRRKRRAELGPRGKSPQTNHKLLALLLVLGLVIAACGSDDGTDTTEAGDTDTTTGVGTDTTTGDGTDTTTGGGEEVDLVVWVTRDYYIPPDGFESFMAEYPNINVTWELQSNDDILAQLQVRRDAGQELPDVLGAEDAFLIASFVEAGLVGPHDDIAAAWAEEDPEQYELLLPLVWDETAIDGVKYGASITANFDVLYYNAEWFEEAGVTVPFESLDGVLEAMRAMKATRPDSTPFTVQAQAGFGVTTLKTMLAAAGTPFEGPIPDLTSEGGIYTINWFLDAVADDLLPIDAIAWGEDESRGAFVSTEAGLILDGFTTAADFSIDGFAYPDQWNLTPVPLSQSGGGDDGVALSAARTWAVLDGTEHPDEAALVLRYIAETPNLIAAAGNGSVPMRQTEAINDPALQEIWPFFNEELKAAYLGSTPTPAGAAAGDVEVILEQMFGEIVTGRADPAEDIAAEYQAQLDGL